MKDRRNFVKTTLATITAIVIGKNSINASITHPTKFVKTTTIPYIKSDSFYDGTYMTPEEYWDSEFFKKSEVISFASSHPEYRRRGTMFIFARAYAEYIWQWEQVEKRIMSSRRIIELGDK